MERLEKIVRQIDNNELDIDILSEKIKEANEIIAFCKDKLTKADREVEKLLQEKRQSEVMGNLMLAAHNEGVGSCWIHRAKEEFESEEGKEILRSLGIEGEYEGIGHCALGYTEGEYPEGHERKDNWVYYIK